MNLFKQIPKKLVHSLNFDNDMEKLDTLLESREKNQPKFKPKFRMVQRVRDYLHSLKKEAWKKRVDSRELDFKFAAQVMENQTSHIEFAIYPSDHEEYPFLKNEEPIK